MVDLDNVDYHEIARRGDTEVMTVFLEAGLDADLRDDRGYTLLMIAAYNDKAAMVELLHDNGASIDAPDPAGNTPLMGLCFKGHAALAERLLAWGADPNARNNAGATPLMMAAMFKQAAIAEHLLAHGADSDMTDADTRTAADYARSYGHPEMVEMLEAA